MNYVLAKIKEKEDTFEKLYSGEELFSVPSDLDSAIDYEPARLLEEDEWFQLDNFSDRKFCIDLLKKDFRSTEYEEVKRARTETIEYICSYQENNYFFQRILKQNIFQKKRLTLGDNVVLDKGEKSIVINSTPDAVFLKEDEQKPVIIPAANNQAGSAENPEEPTETMEVRVANFKTLFTNQIYKGDYDI